MKPSNLRIFRTDIPMSETVKEETHMDMLRAVFFSRLQQITVDRLLHNPGITPELKSELQHTQTALQVSENKFKDAVSKEDISRGQWLSKELSKDKVLDINNILEDVAMIEGDEQEDMLGMLQPVIQRIVASKGKKVNLLKFHALLRLIDFELQNDMLGHPSLVYNPANDTLLPIEQSKPKQHARV